MKKTLKSLDLNLISGLILGIIVLIMGVVVMVFKSFGLIDIVLYVSILFYIYALFSTIMYFVRRKEGDYELLLLSLINIIAATFMFVFKKDNPPMILGAGMSIYTILLVANRGCKIILLKNQNNYMWTVKFIVTFLIAFLGMLTTFNLFNEVTVQTMMYGFYFMSLGFMLTIENIIEIFITDATFRKILSKVLDEPNDFELEEVEETVVNKNAVKGSAKNMSTVKRTKETEIKIEEPKKKAGRPKKETAKAQAETKVVKKESVKTSTKTKEPVQKVEITNKTKIEEPKRKAGRPKKETIIETPKKKPGRPKKVS